ncbi:MAG: cytochrome c3 family protein [Burkholderiales bacterium]|jgi:hypothetical protein|nr:cytochrome c3 family protein [Burkholderiales bacterium]
MNLLFPSALVALVLLLSASIWAQNAAPKVTGKHAEANLSCFSCHNQSAPTQAAPQFSCILCHGLYKGTEREETIGRRKFKINVHDAHPGQLDCTICHTAHKPPKLYCNECHSFKVIVK